jgi:type VI secretion system protein ImpJ
MASDKLPRVRWQMGQALLPDHLIAQEESVLAENRIKFGLSSLPSFGIAKLQWNDSLLRDGILSLISLTWILPSGELVDIPGNAKSQPFNMNVAGTTHVSIYIHFLMEEMQKESAAVFQMNKDEDTVERIIYTIETSSNQNHTSAFQTLKLAEFKKDGQGVWSASEDYIPPLLQVGTSPFFLNTINYLTQLLEAFHFKMEREIAAIYLSGESLFSAKQCLMAVYKLQHFFCNLKHEIHYHPYLLYEVLKMFYIDLCFYQKVTPENVELPYLHTQLRECFRKIFEPLLHQIQEMKSKSPYVPFKKEEGMFVIPKLPKEAKEAKELYFLIQKPKVTMMLSVEGVKLASKSRIAMMHQMALQGIPYKKIERPPFQHTFGAEVDFFLIVEGEEWDHALGEGTLAFYDQTYLEGVNAYLYWRQG